MSVKRRRVGGSELFECAIEKEQHLSLTEAALQSRLSPDELSDQELTLFALQMWIENPREELILENALKSLEPPFTEDPKLATRIYYFLYRYGYINFGVFQQKANIIPVTIAHRPLRVVVIGAGLAGLAAARQLKQFGFEVVVLEAKKNCGGRVHTYTLQENADSPNTICEFGGMIITGLGGNPIAIVAKQIDMRLQKIRSRCPIYDWTGNPVSRQVDELVEKEFNKLLDASAFLACERGLTEQLRTEHGINVSLGETLFVLFRLQERAALQKLIPLERLLLKLNQEMLPLLQKLGRYIKRINKLYDELSNEPLSVIQKNRTPSEAFFYAAGAGATAADASSTPSASGSASASSSGARSSSRNSTAGAGDQQSEEQQIEDLFRVRCKERDLRALLEDFEEQETKYLELQEKIRQAQEKIDRTRNGSEVYLDEYHQRLFQWHISNLEFANGTNLCNLSLAEWNQDDDYSFTGSHVFAPDGLGKVSDAFSQGLTIHYGLVVKEIRYDPKGAEVAALNSATNRLQRFSCDVVLCTLPLGVLKETVRLMAEDGDLGAGAGGEDVLVPTSVPFAASKRGAQAATTGKRPASASASASPSPSPTPDGGGGGPSAAKRACTVADSGASASTTPASTSASASASPSPSVTSGAAAAAAAAATSSLPAAVSSPGKRSMRKALKTREENAPLFFPPLPPWKVDIINKMGFGSLNKVFLMYEKPFWDANNLQMMGYVNEHTAKYQDDPSCRSKRGEHYLFWTFYGNRKPAVIGSFLAGDSAAFTERDYKEYIGPTDMHEILKKIYGDQIPMYDCATVTFWHRDIYERGCYSYVSTQCTGSAYEVLAEPLCPDEGSGDRADPEKIKKSQQTGDSSRRTLLPRVFFAGEHTIRKYPATVHGALLSGLREAAHIADYMLGRHQFAASTAITPFHEQNFNELLATARSSSTSGSGTGTDSGCGTSSSTSANAPAALSFSLSSSPSVAGAAPSSSSAFSAALPPSSSSAAPAPLSAAAGAITSSEPSDSDADSVPPPSTASSGTTASRAVSSGRKRGYQ